MFSLTLSAIAPRVRAILASLVLAFAVLAPAAISLAPQPAQALTCMLESECIDITKKGAGGCDGETCFASDSQCPNGGGRCYTDPTPIPLAIRIGGVVSVADLSSYIAIVFNYSLLVAALIASVMFVIGGFQYLTAGDSDRVAKGKKRIADSLIGIVLLLLAQTLLRTINPDLVALRMPRIEVTKKRVFASCAVTEACYGCGVKYNILIDRATGAMATATGQCGASNGFTALPNEYVGDIAARYELGPECIARGCDSVTVPSSGGEAACSMTAFRCRIALPNERFACGHPPVGAPTEGPAGTAGGYACLSCKGEGESCDRLGANDTCCGGFCADTATGNKCSSGEPGDSCDDDGECRSGICQTNWGNSCSSGLVGAPCDRNSECRGGNFCQTAGTNTCSPGTLYSYCDDDSECKGGLKCIKYAGYENVCMPRDSGEEALIECESNGQCGAGGYCAMSGGSPSFNFCTNGAVGVPCDADNQCASGICASNICTNGDLGSRCENGNDCRLGGKPGHCYTSGDFGSCVTGGKGSRCDGAGDCEAGLKCANNLCVPSSDTPAASPSEQVNPYIGT